MKKLLLLSVCTLFIFSSCKKNSSVAPANTFSATIDGVDESFNTNTVAQIGTGIELNSNLSISGKTGSGPGADGLSITLEQNNSITTATYINSTGDDAGFTSVLYSKGPFSLVNPIIYVTDVNGTYPTNVKITAISNTNIQGTFSGKLLFTDGKTIKPITNGKFNLKLN